MKNKVSSLLVLFVATIAFSQVIVEEEITTDTVNIFAESNGSKKSAASAMLSSLVLPGFGHHYLERPRSALAFLTIDAVSILGFLISRQYAERLMGDAVAFSSVSANASGASPTDERFWQHVGEYMDIASFNATKDLNGLENERYIGDGQWWHWGDESQQKRYREIREDSRRYRIASTFFLASLVLNRVVSFVEIRATTRYKGIQSGSRLSFTPDFTASPTSLGLNLHTSF